MELKTEAVTRTKSFSIQVNMVKTQIRKFMIFNIVMKTILICFSLPCFASFCHTEMTLEEKVGQLLMVHFHGEIANEDAKILIQKVHVGSFIYYNWANGLNSPEQVLSLSSSLQNMCSQNRLPIPLFIAIDQEGGVVARLTKKFTIFPGNKALGITNDPELAQQCAFSIGQELHAVGVNFNLSPVVDVNINPRNPVIGIRAFGDSTDVVIPFAENTIQGYHRAGIITSLKHFPGHGDVEVDSHKDLPVIKKSKQQLENVELLPFIQLASQADTIMTAHIMVPSIDPINCATLSKTILDILRKEIRFKGVIISDSLVMKGVLKNCPSLEDAVIQAFNAGCDILMLGGRQLNGTQTNLESTVNDVERIHQALVNAVKTGLISEQRLNDAVQRILNLKSQYNLSLITEKEDGLKFLVNTPQNNLIAKKIATLALNITKRNNFRALSLDEQKIFVIAPELIKDSIGQTSLLQLGKKTYSQLFKGLNPTEEDVKEANELAKNADLVIFFSYNAWKNSSQVDLVHSLLTLKKRLVIIALRDPLDAALFPQADLIITTYSPTAPSVQAACESLCERITNSKNQ